MKNRKFNKHNREKKVNTIIEIRTEILKLIREFGDDLDRELYDSEDRKFINEEVKQIAKMVRDKDSLVQKANNLPKISKNDREKNDELTEETRMKIVTLLRKKRDSIVVGQYDAEELEIVDRELLEMQYLIKEKDRLVPHLNPKTKEVKQPKVNPYLSKYFDMSR